MLEPELADRNVCPTEVYNSKLNVCDKYRTNRAQSVRGGVLIFALPTRPIRIKRFGAFSGSGTTAS